VNARKLAAAASLAILVAVVVGVAQGHAPRGWLGWDLASFRAAGRLLLAGTSIYDYDAQRAAHAAEFGAHGFAEVYPFGYPPQFAMEMIPLAKLPHELAFVIVLVASLAAAALAARSLTGEVRDVAFVTATAPGVLALLAGQLSFVALGIVAACHALLARKRSFAAGLVLSTLAFKPQLLVFLPLAFLFRKDLRALAALAVGVAVQVGACFAFDARDALAWPRALRAFDAFAMKQGDEWSFTWRTFFAAAGASTSIAIVVVIACAAAGVFAMWRARGDLDLCFAVAVLATFAAALHCFAYDWVVLACPLMLLLPRANPSRRAWYVLGALYVASALFAASVKAQEHAFGFAFHPAMPALAGVSAWLAVRVRAKP
jgi:hypothetical protein